jgi:hypothetical protein
MRPTIRPPSAGVKTVTGEARDPETPTSANQCLSVSKKKVWVV